MRIDAKSESGLVDGLPSMKISPDRDPYTDFTSFLVSRLVSGFITLFSQALAFYHVSHVNHTSEQHLNDLPPCGSKFILISLLLNLAPPRLITSFLRLR